MLGCLTAVLAAEASVPIVKASREALPKDPFYAPPLGSLSELSLGDAARLHRRTQSGRVLAVWRQDNLIIRTRNGEYLRSRLRPKSPLPKRGDSVEIVGTAESDGFRINLVDALWRPSPDLGIAEEPTVSLSGSDLLKNSSNETRLRTDLYGRRLTLSGIVHASSHSSDGTLFYLEDAGHLIPVDISGRPALKDILQPGSHVAVTGICLIEVGSHAADSDLPHIHGIVLLPCETSDVFLIAKPSWWTPQKFWMLVAALAVLIVLFILRTMRLQTFAREKELELKREQFDNEANRLKVEERTRLAVELHDTLSQSLAGVSLELAAAGESIHIQRASRALKSARAELRNCLWDLRSRTFDETDVREAVLKTLVPVIDESRLKVRFSVSRSSLSENSAHTLLCAIRELVVNALVHGKADTIKIAGTMNDGVVLCSVSDNGCGFDLALAPGVDDGHFGLQGIRERINRLGGSFTIESSPGHGTRAAFTIPAREPPEFKS